MTNDAIRIAKQERGKDLLNFDDNDFYACAPTLVNVRSAFGLSLAEGMLCGAVPVVTSAGSLPWVAGGTGVVIAAQTPEAVAAGVHAACALAPAAGAAARERVLAVFTTQHRRAGLQQLVASLAGAPAPANAEARAA